MSHFARGFPLSQPISINGAVWKSHLKAGERDYSSSLDQIDDCAAVDSVIWAVTRPRLVLPQ